VLTRLGRRVLEAGAGLFALLGFVFVPLGKRTGFEHVVAIFSTPAAKEAGHELFEASLRLRQQVLDAVAGAGQRRPDRPPERRQGADSLNKPSANASSTPDASVSYL
jgi:hypothetical protein